MKNKGKRVNLEKGINGSKANVHFIDLFFSYIFILESFLYLSLSKTRFLIEEEEERRICHGFAEQTSRDGYDEIVG